MAGNIHPLYGSSAAFTITLASLATDTNLRAGRHSTAIDFSALATGSKPVEDVLIGGKVTTGTSPTGGQIEVWAYGSYKDGPTYLDTITGTDAAYTPGDDNTKFRNLKGPLAVMPVTTTSNISYYFLITLAQFFGGKLPKNGGVYVVHNTGVNLNSTSGNHEVVYTPWSRQYT
jgi:hypothetical protein